MTDSVLTVRQLNLYVRSLIEGDPRLINVTVTGELSNFKNHYSSGHWYFTLKDNDASIRCVMFRGNNSRVKFIPEDGVQVILRGKVSIYEKDGQYQFYAEEMSASGLGDIALMFEQTKARLEAEGMLDPDSKRKIPKFPKEIAVITSPTGAAVRDIFNILTRRWPIADVKLYPVSVQGDLAVPEMLKALDEVYNESTADVIIIGRGGGSAEDLWVFNSEPLARKIYESPIPVISAVGHETDFTICDFVADLRAPTPSAAAELAVPDMEEIKKLLLNYSELLSKALKVRIGIAKAQFERFSFSGYLKNPKENIIEKRNLELDKFTDRLYQNINSYKMLSENRLQSISMKLDALSPLKVLSRGYSAVLKDDKAVTSVKMLNTEDKIEICMSDGRVNCTVEQVYKENNDV